MKLNYFFIESIDLSLFYSNVLSAVVMEKEVWASTLTIDIFRGVNKKKGESYGECEQDKQESKIVRK